MARKVLHLVTTLNPGGIERWLLDMLRTVDRKRYEMDFCCKGLTEGQLAPQAKALGAKVWHNPLYWTHIRYGLRLRQIIEGKGYSLVHNHLTVYAGFPAYIASLAGVPSITSLHNTAFESAKILNPVLRRLRSLYARLSIRMAIRMSKAITGCSQGVLDALERQYDIGGIPSHVLYYGIDIPDAANAMQHSQFRRELGLSEQTQIVVHIGRFAAQKNHAGLVRIAQMVLRTNPLACFVLIGDGPLHHDIETMVEELGLSKAFRFLGIRHAVEQILTCCDVFLFPSKWEGFGLVALEANAAGIPVVGSDVPGIREAVEDGKTAFLCPREDESAFARAVCQLLNDPALRRQMGKNGIERVRSQFSKEKSAGELCRLYDTVLKN